MPTTEKTNELIYRIPIALASIAVTVTLGLAVWQLEDPLTAPTIFPFAETYYAKSIAAKDPSQAVAFAQMATRVSPHRAGNWVLLSYAYAKADKRLSNKAIEALRTSYSVSPLDPQASQFRLSQIMYYWAELPSDIRNSAREEASAYAQTWVGQKFLGSTVYNIANPSARVLFGFIMISGHYYLMKNPVH